MCLVRDECGQVWEGNFYEPGCIATIRLLLRRTLVRSVRY